MTRILVFSDTHGMTELCSKIIKTVPCDLILHAGDINMDVKMLMSEFPDKDIRYVQGNNEFFDKTAFDIIVEIAGKRIFLTHGHKYRVKHDSDYRTLAEAAKRNKCDIAVFGHTHMPYEGETDGVMLLNPGSAGFGNTYGVIEIENGAARTCII